VLENDGSWGNGSGEGGGEHGKAGGGRGKYIYHWLQAFVKKGPRNFHSSGGQKEGKILRQSCNELATEKAAETEEGK